MKTSFANFWRRNLGFFRLAVITNLEYRLNYFTDALLQPTLATVIEATLWIAVFHGAGTLEINGFGRESYLAYVLWAAFIGRITSNWMYEFKMIEEIELGTVNNLLVRPLSFYGYYLSQFFGYKLVTTAISLFIPVAAGLIFRLPVEYSRIPLALALVLYLLVFVHTLAFCIATLAFRLNKVGSFTVAKNLGLWLFSGELFPLDLIPAPYRDWMIALPFSNLVYIPVGYITGRFDVSLVWQGFLSITVGTALLGLLGAWSWRSGLRSYSGTGA